MGIGVKAECARPHNKRLALPRNKAGCSKGEARLCGSCHQRIQFFKALAAPGQTPHEAHAPCAPIACASGECAPHAARNPTGMLRLVLAQRVKHEAERQPASQGRGVLTCVVLRAPRQMTQWFDPTNHDGSVSCGGRRSTSTKSAARRRARRRPARASGVAGTCKGPTYPGAGGRLCALRGAGRAPRS